MFSFLLRSRRVIGPLLFITCPMAAAGEGATLWRIDREGIAPSWLVESPAGEAGRELSPELEALFARSRTLVLEMELEPGALLPALPATLEANPNRRRTAVDPNLYRRALALLRTHGITGDQVARLRPWALGLALGAPPARSDPLELLLLRRAATQRKNVRTLETLAEAVADLDTMAPRHQEGMIRAGLARGDKAPILLEELLKAWQAKDGARMQQLMQATRRHLEPYRTEEHQKRLAGRLAKLLEAGNTLVVTSAPAREPQSGLVGHLRERGWNLRRVTHADGT